MSSYLWLLSGDAYGCLQRLSWLSTRHTRLDLDLLAGHLHDLLNTGPEHRFSRRRRLGRTRQVTRGGVGTGSNGGVRRSSTIEREGRCTLPHDLFVEQPARKRAVGIRLSRLQIRRRGVVRVMSCQID